MTIEFGPDDDPIQLFQEIIVRSCYTPRWFYRASPGDTVVDLGANIGMFALSVAWGVQGLRCHCFEPAAAARERLLGNVNVNQLGDRVRVYPYAIASTTGSANLNAAASSIHRSFYSNSMTKADAGEVVESLCLGEAISRANADRIDLLKVDIEGAERDAFAACSPEQLAPVRRVSLEYHDHFRPGARSTVETALRGAGFVILAVEPADPSSGVLYAARP
jgi:FkbM family methyltransferase